MNGGYCRVCERESELCYKCDECGKPFHGDSDGSGTQQLRPDGGVDLDTLSTHDLVGVALVDLGDEEATDGIPTDDVVEWVVERTELEEADVLDAIASLHNRGRVYEPQEGRLRRTPDIDRWSQ